MKILETIKSHPIYIIGALGVVFVGYIYLTSGSGTPAGDGSSGDIYAAQNAAGDQLQLASMAAQVQSAAIGADLTKTQIASQTSVDIAGLSKDLAVTQINANQETTDLANTLTANVAMSNIRAGVDTAQIQSNTSIATTQAVTGALIAQSAQSASVAQAAIAASSAAAARSCGFFGSIFGC